MTNSLRALLVIGALLFFFSVSAVAQAENVPAIHPVYTFLKRMEVRGIIERYHDAVLPLSRRQVADFLATTRGHSDELTASEREVLENFSSEFQYELSGSTENFHTLIDSREPDLGSTLKGFLSAKEKYLYVYSDTNLTFFVDGLLTWDVRRSTGDALGSANATFVQFGGRIRGTIFDRLGYYLQGTNAQFYGSRDLLRRDKIISQAFALNVENVQNFDFVEGYMRYDANVVSVQVGRERLLYGNGYGDKLILSDNPRVFDFVRADFEYKSLKYTFFHGWLLGKRSSVSFTLSADTSHRFDEPVVADKYIAAHRLGFSFPRAVDVGFQEVVIYSNRAPDLAYLNPLTLIESAQRSREERDNVFWAFDAQTRFLRNVELHASIFFDDINFPKWGTDSWENRYAYQVGAMLVNPLGMGNTGLMAEYTRIEPFTFSHGRSRDNDYGSLSRFLGHHIGPNADSWFFRLNHYFAGNVFGSVGFEYQREGDNIRDALTDTLITNVGGDFLVPHRGGKDSDVKQFLGGNLVRTYRVQALGTYEIVNEIFLDGRYEFTKRQESLKGDRFTDHDFGLAIRIDF